MTVQTKAVCCNDLLQVFDTIIVLTSFVLDLIVAEVMTGSDGEQAAAIIVVFLLWRILRIVNGQQNAHIHNGIGFPLHCLV